MTNTSQTSQKRRFPVFRFTLLALLLLVVIAAIGISFKVSAVRQQHTAVTGLSKLWIIVHYDHQYDALPAEQLAVRGTFWGSMAFPNQPLTNPQAPAWLRRQIGDDYFQTVNAVTLFATESHDIQAALPHLKELAHLKEIFLSGPSCGNAIPSYIKAKELLERELPNVKVTSFGIPVVG